MQDRLKEIRDRRNKITPGNWMVCLGSGNCVCTGIIAENQTTGKTVFIADFLSEKILNESEKNYDHRDNMNFVVNTPADIDFLLEALQEAQGKLQCAQDGKTFLEKGLKRCDDSWAKKENEFIARIELLKSIVQQHEEKNTGLKSTIE